jgi:hypothetical protein
MPYYHADYRTLWIDADYKPDMGSACAVKPPPQGWLAAYHFASVEHALDDIENGHIKVTRISEANDPFEFEGLTGGEKFPSAKCAIKKWKEEANQETGILCFSKDWTSPALWAHYSSRHEGICLGFWIREEKLLHVVYDTERTAIGYSGFPESLSDGTKELLFKVKAQDWNYEEEVRYPVKLRETIEREGKRFFQFDDTLKLSEVILGERCRKTVPEVRSSLVQKYPDVAVFKARAAFGFFKMVPDEDTIPP